MDDKHRSEKTAQGHAVEQAHRRLRSAILQGNFAPGALFTQAELTTKLDVGRTPLREAIRVLQEEGLLVSQPNRTVRVAGFSREDLEGLYALRIVHESVAIRLTIPKLTVDDMGELRALVSKMDHFAESQDYPRYSEPHRKFHALLVSGQGARGVAFSAQLFDHCERYRHAYATSGTRSYQMSAHEHHEILDAAISRDATRCAHALIGHYARTVAGVIAHLDPGAPLQQVEFACAVALSEPDAKASARLWSVLRKA